MQKYYKIFALCISNKNQCESITYMAVFDVPIEGICTKAWSVLRIIKRRNKGLGRKCQILQSWDLMAQSKIDKSNLVRIRMLNWNNK